MSINYRKIFILGLSTLVSGLSILGFHNVKPVSADSKCSVISVELGHPIPRGSPIYAIRVKPLHHQGTGNYGLGGTIDIHVIANLRRVGTKYIEVYGRVSLAEAPGSGSTVYASDFSKIVYVNQLVNPPRTSNGDICNFSHFAETSGFVNHRIHDSGRYRYATFSGNGIIQHAECPFNRPNGSDRNDLFCNIYFHPAILYFGR